MQIGTEASEFYIESLIKNTLKTGWSTIRIRASDLDQLFPWMIFSIFINMVVWLTVLFGFAAPLIKPHRVVLSTVEIRLAKVMPQPSVAVAANPRVAVRTGYAMKTIEQRSSSNPAVRKIEYNAYLKSWESRIMEIAQKKLFAKQDVAIPKGRVVSAVTIAPDGRLLSITLTHKSAKQILNVTVEKLVIEAAPFPALPAVWQHPPTALRIVRTWNFA